jgi:ketosteroid isomerase-like protein
VADERVVLFRKWVADWNEGRRDLDWNLIHPEFELHSVLMGHVMRGPDAIRAWWREIDQQFDAWRLSVTEERDLASDRFLLTGTVRLRGRGSGLEMDQDIAWLLGFEGERLVLMKTYTDLGEAFAEAGIDTEDQRA